ncbi:coiled-coil domain-containing protein 125 [Cebidichthys violaceus]|uniref:coiled-coil domain-containing protein 125 n=1 Tax=Cebidichthys violaceus TaxID=271503 RepID=UPI0035CA9637
MQEAGEARSPEDDMANGDLGDGMGVRAAPSSTRNKSQSADGLTETPLSRTEPLGRAGEAAWIPGLKTTGTQQRARWKPPCYSSLVDLSKDELKDRLQEAAEMIDVLSCELEVAHRYVEGKYEALKILQGKAILDKATSHTKSLLQKSEAEAKALEKEVNRLQWELSFNQVQMKESQQSWEQKYNRILNENQTLTDNLEERESEVQRLRAEHSARSQQCLELLSMLSVKEQRAYQGTKPQYSPERDSSVLELAVLGACRCLGAAEACPCSRTAAASRKQLVQLQQELDAQRSRREEASMVADAFRIAFEQQLRKRSDHFLLLADANILKSHHCKAEGANRSPLISVSQRLRGLLPSKTPDDLLETLYRLLDLLNDKDEALAHQRKVSIMLAHSAEELQRRLHLDSHYGPSDPSENLSRSLQTSDAPESKTQPQVPPESKTQPQVPPKSKTQPQVPPESKTQPQVQPQVPPESKTQPQVPPESKTQPQVQPQVPPESKTQPQVPPESKTQPQVQPQVPLESKMQPQVPPESKTQPQVQPQVPLESNVQARQQLELLQPGQPPSLSESRTEPRELADPSQSDIQPPSNHKSHESEIQHQPES